MKSSVKGRETGKGATQAAVIDVSHKKLLEKRLERQIWIA